MTRYSRYFDGIMQLVAAFVLFIFFSCSVRGQTVSQAQIVSQSPAALDTIPPLMAQRKALVSQLAALYQSGATTQQIVAWHQQNDAQIQNLLNQIQSVLPSAGSSPSKPAVMQNVSSATAEFSANQKTLSTSLANLVQQNSGITSLTAIRQWQQNNTALLIRQQILQRSLVQPSTQPLQFVAPQIPPDLSPQLKAYTTLHNQLVQDETTLLNNNLSSDAATRASVLFAWRQQNATLLQQLQNLPSPTAASKSTTTNGASQ